MDISSLKTRIRDIPDFPKKGILFRDITPVLQDPMSLRDVVKRVAQAVKKSGAEVVVGIESRGFIFGAPVAAELGIGFVPIRKKGKLPWRTRQVACTLEYGQEILEIHEDAVKAGQKAVVIDDLLATGGTAQAAAKLVEGLGGKVTLLAFVIELSALKGREKLMGYETFSLLQY